jgi:hypothetical protein
MTDTTRAVFEAHFQLSQRQAKRRPATITIEFVDPWTGEFCAGGTFAYRPERAARGFYSESIRRFRKAAKAWTALRSPKLRLSFQYAKRA